jgi:DNA polymerase III subunit alpha
MATKDNLLKLQQILVKYPGPCEVQVKLVSATSKHFMLQQRVDIGHDLFGELKSLLGPDSVS